jgi:hypothetical protein
MFYDVCPMTNLPRIIRAFLWLYDTSSTYRAANPKFSIRLDGVTWNTTCGANQLTSTLNNIQVQQASSLKKLARFG